MGQTWDYMLAQARLLPTVDLARHADASFRNGHECTFCFTCAALVVVRERASVTVFGEDDNVGFFDTVSLGIRAELTAELWEYWLDVVPPRVMNCTVKLADGTTRRVSYATCEGDDTPRLLRYVRGRRHADRVLERGRPVLRPPDLARGASWLSTITCTTRSPASLA